MAISVILDILIWIIFDSRYVLSIPILTFFPHFEWKIPQSRDVVMELVYNLVRLYKYFITSCINVNYEMESLRILWRSTHTSCKKDVTSMCKICHVYVEGTAALFFSFCKCGWCKKMVNDWKKYLKSTLNKIKIFFF